MSKTVRPPEHLSAKSKALFKVVLRDYALQKHHLELLTLACEARDRAEQARQAVAKDGAYVEGRFGLKAHPAIAVERDSRTAFGRLLQQLNLEVGADGQT